MKNYIKVSMVVCMVDVEGEDNSPEAKMNDLKSDLLTTFGRDVVIGTIETQDVTDSWRPPWMSRGWSP